MGSTRCQRGAMKDPPFAKDARVDRPVYDARRSCCSRRVKITFEFNWLSCARNHLQIVCGVQAGRGHTAGCRDDRSMLGFAFPLYLSKGRRAFSVRGSPWLFLIFVVACLGPASVAVRAQEAAQDPCPRPAVGSAVPEPEDLRSQNGVLKVDLTVRNYKEKDGSTRYCYLLADGSQSPTLRLNPGDLLILNVKNDLADP